ncbi:MAG: AtpZ/AtpI family protein [Lachnospiraceae bacterium]|nr:AtpZ/AtpI family protein [Lachnospiraceae bacterium]
MMVTQFGINMIVPIVACTLLGAFLDRKLGTNFFAIVLFILGALAGGRNVYRFAKRILDEDKETPREKRRRNK